MAVKKVWLGSTGPFLFDDAVLYIDEEGVIAPDNQQAIATNGQIVVQSAPSSPVHVVRKQDLDDAIGDISGLTTRVTTLEAQMAALTPRVTTVENKFVFGTFDVGVSGFFDTVYTRTITYVKVDRLVMLTLPLISGNSTMDFIALSFVPAFLSPAIVGLQYPVIVHDATNGFDWAAAGFVASGGGAHRLDIRLFVGAAGFPLGVTKTLYEQMIVYAI